MFALTKRRALLEGWQSQLCLGDLWGSQVSAYFWNARQVTEGKGAWECCKSLWCLLFKLEAPKPCLVLSAPVFTPQISTSQPHHQCFLKDFGNCCCKTSETFWHINFTSVLSSCTEAEAWITHLNITYYYLTQVFHQARLSSLKINTQKSWQKVMWHWSHERK